jgi:hypothetical protein
MPRNGAGIYSKPTGTTAVSNTVISSSAYNTLMDDFAATFNVDVPVSQGGTGASTAADARENLGVDAALAYTTKSGAYTAVAGDKNGVIRFTAAATLTLTAAATLEANWFCTVIAGSGIVVIDPNASEQINGGSVFVIPSGFAAGIVCDGSAFRTTFLAPIAESSNALAPRNHLGGLTLSNNVTDATNDIDIAVGSCMDSTNTYMLALTSAITKQLDALWVVGTNQGGLDTGSASDTTYHVHLIKRLDTGVVDVLFSTSATSPTLPANYTVFRRIGSIIRASGSIRAFSQFRDEFLLSTPVKDVDLGQGTTANLRTLTVPTGVNVIARLRLRGENAVSNWGVLVSSPDVPDTAPDLLDTPGVSVGAVSGAGDRNDIDVRTNTSAQVRTRATTVNTTIQIITHGWIDARGK